MFDGMPEQFYQFLAAAATTTSRTSATNTAAATTAASLPLPLSFSLHHHHHHHHAAFSTYSPHTQPTFDAPPPYHHLLHPSHFLPRNEAKEENLSLQHDAGILTPRSLMLPEIPWSNDEMLALFRIRSSMDNTWFPYFVWENVSRKLAELGFKRSAEKCKEKFEEEFNNNIISNNCSNKNNASNNYRLFGELEELCINNNNNNSNTNDNINHGDHQQIHPIPPSPPPPDHQPQTSLSQRVECLDDEDEGENEDDDADQVEESKRGRERLGDDEEEEEEEVNTRNDEGENDDHNNNNNNNNNNVEDEQSVDDDSEKTEETTKKVTRKRKRQKKKKKFEMFKGFCEKIVNKMMVQQEQLHCKILQDMVKRDEEKVAKEEAWKQQEIERFRKELEVRAYEQVIAGDRQAKILDCLNKFSSSSNILESHHSFKETLENLSKVPNTMTLSNSSILTHQDSISAHLPPTSCTTLDHTHNSPLATHQTCPNIPTSSSETVALLSPIRVEKSKVSLRMSSSSMDQASQNPNPLSPNDSSRLPSLVTSYKLSRSDHTSTNATGQSDMKVVAGKDDTGRRWPRDEVLALINIRCSLFNNNGVDAHNDRDQSFSKGPLWERISQKMMELGYKRSAKRCKEKWENINKYFRKTKDLNKKRSIDSRTCPYFQQLSHLYSQGTLTGPTDPPINLPGSPENSRSMAFPGTEGGSSTPANCATNIMHDGNEGVVQVPGFDFEF